MASTVKLKWLEQMNASWVVEDCETISSRDGITALYDRLISSQEVVIMPQQVSVLQYENYLELDLASYADVHCMF